MSEVSLLKEMLYWKNKAGELAIRVLELEAPNSQQDVNLEKHGAHSNSNDNPTDCIPIKKKEEKQEDGVLTTNISMANKHKAEIDKDYKKGCGEWIETYYEDDDHTHRDDVECGTLNHLGKPFLCEKCRIEDRKVTE